MVESVMIEYINFSQKSPKVTGCFKCTKEGCTTASFPAQYLLNVHGNLEIIV